jgi:hypothetical protein
MSQFDSLPYKLVTLGNRFVDCVDDSRESVTLHVDHPVTQRAIRTLSKHLQRYVECVIIGTSGAEAARVKVQKPKYATDTVRDCLALTYVTQPLTAFTNDSLPNDVLNAQVLTVVPWQRDYVRNFQLQHLGFVRE